jgi:nitrite reductase/ring-hydroxylating ferredoxin subunit
MVYERKPLQNAAFSGREASAGEPWRQRNGRRPALVASAEECSGNAMPRLELCQAADVADGTALKVETEGLVLAVFNVDGEYYVLDDACTHGPGSLSEGYIEGDVVECNFHNGQFNIRTGEVVLPPCIIPMKTYPTTVEDGKVYIEM